MLEYTPGDGTANLFGLGDKSAQEDSYQKLLGDIPRYIDSSEGLLSVYDFKTFAYNQSPAHSDQFKRALIDSGDLEVFTQNGGQRRTGGQIRNDDYIQLKQQKSWFSKFPIAEKKKT